MRSNKPFLLRVRIISIVCVAISLLLVGKLYSVDIIDGDVYAEKAKRQYARPNQDLWDRGSIFLTDRNGNKVAAATLKTGFTLAIHPDKIPDVEQMFDTLSKIIELEKDSFFFKATKQGDPYEEVGKHLSSESGKRIEDEKLVGTSLFKDRWRFYPGGKLSAHVLGFVGFDWIPAFARMTLISW